MLSKNLSFIFGHPEDEMHFQSPNIDLCNRNRKHNRFIQMAVWVEWMNMCGGPGGLDPCLCMFIQRRAQFFCCIPIVSTENIRGSLQSLGSAQCIDVGRGANGCGLIAGACVESANFVVWVGLILADFKYFLFLSLLTSKNGKYSYYVHQWCNHISQETVVLVNPVFLKKDITELKIQRRWGKWSRAIHQSINDSDCVMRKKYVLLKPVFPLLFYDVYNMHTQCKWICKTNCEKQRKLKLEKKIGGLYFLQYSLFCLIATHHFYLIKCFTDSYPPPQKKKSWKLQQHSFIYSHLHP